jgi:hypothetical protein
MVSHGYQTNDEADNYKAKGLEICRVEGYHCRGESWPFAAGGGYAEAPYWATLAHLQWQLTFGVDMPGLSEDPLLNASYAEIYETFDRYATSVRPPASAWKGAIIALRDGLDAADWKRFPNTTYGECDRTSSDRFSKIAEEFAHRGAAIGDMHAATANAITSRQPKKMNDVGWRVWEGNYGNQRITQLDPEGSSIGWWRVGPKDQAYGRFARGFEHASNKTEMKFALDNGLWGGLPFDAPNSKNPPRALTLKVTYFDQKGAFDVSYAGAKGCTTAATIKGTGSERWVTWEGKVADGRFGQGCGGADVVLGSRSVEDTIIHGMEIFDPKM